MTWFDLTSAQRGLFFAHALAPENPAYSTAEYVEFDGPIDATRLCASIEAAYAEFEQLRTTFRLGAHGPQQRVHAPPLRPLQVVAVAGETAALEWMRTDLARPMNPLTGDVTRTALLAESEGPCWWYHAAHHLVLDGYGAQQLITRVAELYNGADTRTPIPLRSVVAADPERAVDAAAAAAFWDARITKMHGVTALAGRQAPAAPRALRRVLDLAADEQRTLTVGARRLGSTWADLLTVAVGSYVARIGAASEARLGTPMMNRVAAGTGTLISARTVCTAMNVLPITIPGCGTLAHALQSARDEQQEVRAFGFTRQEDLARRLHRRDQSAQLFGLQLNLIPFTLEIELRYGASAVHGVVRNLTAGPVEDMTLGVRGAPGRGGNVRLELDANPDLYTIEDLELHLGRLRSWILTLASARLDDQLQELDLLNSSERHLIVEEFNRTAHPRVEATLRDRFLAQAHRTPDAVALICDDQERTYSELLQSASSVATRLRAAGVRAGDVVGVARERGIALFEGIYGVVLSGAVYLPVDVDLPQQRIADILADSSATALLGDDDCPTLIAHDAGGAPTSSRSANEGDDGAAVDAAAYVLFTSGSTGRPKGVVISHRAIDNRLAWMQHHLPLRTGDRVLHKTPISFDVSIWELFWPLQVGAAIVIAAPGSHRDPRAIADLIATQNVTTAHFVPSMLRAFLADATSRNRVSDAQLRHLVTSGEALTAELARDAARAFGVPPTNLYGPTEAAIDVTAWDCAPEDDTVPIGRPIWNTTCYVLDAQRVPVPIGVAGELWLGGIQLADGYAGRDDLTAERFIDNPFHGGRLYRTGDVAAWRSDGALSYLGRADDQVKLRGQRLELGEIEAIASAVDDVAGAAAGLVNDELVVWFVPSLIPQPPGTTPRCRATDEAQSALAAAFAAALPASLQPHHLVAVESIPLSSSGKTDRRRLAETAAVRRVRRQQRSGPRDLIEQRVCAVFADVLGTASIEVEADFFSLGGDSLRVLRVLSGIEQEFGTVLDLADIFAHPSAAELAKLIAGDSATASTTAELLTLRSGSPDQTPLFLLPPAGGLGWCYVSLLRSLPPVLPVHTIQAPGLLDGAPEPAGDLRELARRQLNVIRRLVDDGPFHIGGWSLGGMAAQEVAALAAADGQQVGAVVLLDAYPSDQWRHLSEPTESEALVGILRLGGVEPPEGELDRAQTLRLLRDSGSAIGALPEVAIKGCIASVVQASAIVRGSEHDTYDAPVTLVRAAAPRPETFIDPDGWRKYVGSLELVDLPVTHGELLRPPTADRVAQLVADRIAAANSRSTR
ncbi:non-ribosomal peptide synthetase [Cumulibacter soli]|uniref:non-ribosomal peptide synthetase n=1 Tax=Cumulibacter soli TaxID=2546344 RepID=UPI001067657D|nr:non-ribosomal peptide synthetase [Cumulibacter soli]